MIKHDVIDFNVIDDCQSAGYIKKGTAEAKKLLFTYFAGKKKHFYFIFNMKVSKRWTYILPRLVLGQFPKREVDIQLNTVYLATMYN